MANLFRQCPSHDMEPNPSQFLAPIKSMNNEAQSELATAADEIEKAVELIDARDAKSNQGWAEMTHSEYMEIRGHLMTALQSVRKTHGAPESLVGSHIKEAADAFRPLFAPAVKLKCPLCSFECGNKSQMSIHIKVGHEQDEVNRAVDDGRIIEDPPFFFTPRVSPVQEP